MNMVEFRGEKMTRRELAGRYAVLHPTEGPKLLRARIIKETGVEIYITEISKQRRRMGLPAAQRWPRATDVNGIVQTLPIKEIVIAAKAAEETQAARIVSVLKSLRDCLNILGSKDAVKQVLEVL